MAAPTPNNTSDSFGPTPMGCHSGLAPTLLSPTQLAWGVNITCRGGYPRNRPPIRKLSLTYTGDSQANATTALFQGAAFYTSLGNNPNCLIASIGGRIFRYTINNNACSVQDVTPPNDPNNSLLEEAWLAQGQDFLIIQNGEERPIAFDGAGSRRLPIGNSYLPVGRQIHYSNGRFIVAVPSIGNNAPCFSYIASDLVYNTTSGTPQYNYRDSILRTTENQAILGGQSFAVPLTSGPITSLFSVAIPDTSLGQGPLMIGTTGGIYSVNLPLDSTLWTTTDQPSQVVTLPTPGPTGFYSVTLVNGDAWYRAPDGLRSFATARRDFNTWVQTPLSFELARVLPYDTIPLLNHASCLTFNNRLLCTCSPYRVTGRGTAHRGLVALDFNNISSITSRSQPAYDGLWTGIPILQLVKGIINGVERCFAFALDSANRITLYEIGYDDTNDFDYDGSTDIATECWFESPALLGRQGDPRASLLKRITNADLWLSDLAGPSTGEIPITIQFRSDYYPCYLDWAAFTLCAPACAQPASCAQPITTQPQYATFLRLPQPPDNCLAVTSRPARTGYFFQIKLGWTGHLALHNFLLWASPQPENMDGRACSTTPTCTALQCCIDDLFTYAIESTCALAISAEIDSTLCATFITANPSPVTTTEGQTVELTFTYEGNGGGPFTIQWYYNDTPLTDGPSGGSTISGSTTTTLTITNSEIANSGDYYAIVTDTGYGSGCTATTDTVAVLVEAAPPANSPTAYWRMDEINAPIVGGQGPATDRADQVNASTLQLTLGTIPGYQDSIGGVAASAYFLSTASGLLDTTALADLAYTTGSPVSIAFWVNYQTDPALGDEIPRLELLLGGAEQIGLQSYFSGPNRVLYAFINGDSYQDITINPYNPSTATWYFIILVYDAGILSLYVDGVLAGATGVAATLATAASSALSLYMPNAFGVGTLVSQFGLWMNHALTAPQIAYLYNAGAGRDWPITLP